MGPKAPRNAAGVPAAPAGIVLSSGYLANVSCVDRNRYVDLAAGFGALLLGHAPPAIARALSLQSERLWLALGDVYPSDAKIGLLARLAELSGIPRAQGILAQSGADAVSAALKTAALATGRPGVVAFEGGYHGLSYGPLSITDLRRSYRAPFSEQLNPHVDFAPYPGASGDLDRSLARVRELLLGGAGAIVVEPILGRGGVIVPPAGFLSGLRALADEHSALLVADEVWTGLGRSGALSRTIAEGVVPDLLCLGKGLGGGLPISACLGSAELMSAWSRDAEVVHTATFAGAPLACATALATLDQLVRGALAERAAREGERLLGALRSRLERFERFEVRGSGMMLGIELGTSGLDGPTIQRRLLERGYLTSTGGGARDVLVLTPSLVIAPELLDAFVETLGDVVTAELDRR